GEAGEERAGPAPPLQDDVVASLPFQQSGELKSGRSGPDDDVVAHHGRDANGRGSEGSEITTRTEPHARPRLDAPSRPGTDGTTTPPPPAAAAPPPRTSTPPPGAGSRRGRTRRCRGRGTP